MFVASVLANLFPFEEMVEMLNKVPDKLWVPEVPERFVGKTLAELKAMLMHTEHLPMTAELVTFVGTAPETFDWTKQSTGCVAKVRD